MVIVYSTSNCPNCKKAMRYLDIKGVEYKHVDVGVDLDAREDMLKANGGKALVPTIIINDEVMVGFDRKAIDQALA